MPVPSTTVCAIVTRWANEQNISIPNGTTFDDADSFDADPPVFTMRERMHITLGPALRASEFLSGNGTTIWTSRSRIPKQVEVWTLDDLPEIPNELWAAMPMTLDYVNIFSKKGLTNCTSQARICVEVLDLLTYVSECIGGQEYNVTDSKALVIGLLDLAVWRLPTTLALVVECMTPWTFEVGDDALLAEIYNSHKQHHEMWADDLVDCPPELKIPRKVYDAVRQLYGYTSINKRRYGILTTFTTTFLFKRDHGGKLFISKGLAANRYDPMTVLEAITRLLLKKNPPADEDLSEAGSSSVRDPYAQEIPKQSKSAMKKTKKKSKQPPSKKHKANDTQAPSEEGDRDLVLITDLPNYHVIAGGGSASVVATELDDIPVAIKAVDTCKKPELLDELQHECDTYAVLEALQGDCIPILARPAPVVLWDGMLEGLVLSLIKGQTLEAMGTDGIASIPLECRLQAVLDLRKIHSLGVLHGDIAERNLIWCQDDRPRIVFVDFGRAMTSCDVEDVQLEWEECGLRDILQIHDNDDANSEE
ncbi:hypothetical protein AC1031_003600 [Aphanomyces cochlioides]|nr:hypothetical protein AC1031_003600 [Aphanomyces cochlioides]